MVDLLEVLGSKARLSILRALSDGDRYVSELMEEVGMDGKRAQHHLQVLAEAGIVTSYKESRRRYYRLVKALRLEVSPSPNRRFVAQARDVEEQSAD